MHTILRITLYTLFAGSGVALATYVVTVPNPLSQYVVGKTHARNDDAEFGDSTAPLLAAPASGDHSTTQGRDEKRPVDAQALPLNRAAANNQQLAGLNEQNAELYVPQTVHGRQFPGNGELPATLDEQTRDERGHDEQVAEHDELPSLSPQTTASSSPVRRTPVALQEDAHETSAESSDNRLMRDLIGLMTTMQESNNRRDAMLADGIARNQLGAAELTRLAQRPTNPATPAATEPDTEIWDSSHPDASNQNPSNAQSSHPASTNPNSPNPYSTQPPASEPAAPVPPDQALTQPMITRVPGEGDDRLDITIENADIRDVLRMLGEQGNLNILATKDVTGTVSATLKNVDALSALDAILRSTQYDSRQQDGFIYVGTAADFAAMRQARDRLGTRLYHPNYVTATALQTLITPLLTPEISKISVTNAAAVGVSADLSSTEGDTYAGQDALLVRDYENVLNELDQIIKRIDQKPTQVAIEAMILSVKLDDSNELGVDFELFRNKDYLRIASGMPLADVANMNFTDGGLKIGFLDSSLAMFLNALEKIGDTNVIATPHLMCLNKHAAQILIGEELGYVNQTLTAEGTIVPEVEFLEVGTQLRLRPYISSDGMVRMEIHPEVSKGNVRVEDGLTLPDKETTQVTTNIMVPDGNTVVIGGLIRDELTQSATQIPLLGSLPIVGPVFRKNVEGTIRQEILVLITPKIVYEPEMSCAANVAAAEFHQRQAIYADKQIVFGRRYLGRKYMRLARDAWAVGNAKRALKLINLAINFDPLNRESIRLRNDIWEGSGIANEDVAAGAALDDSRIPPPLHEPLDASPPYHPRDPGRPAERFDVIPHGELQ